MFVERVKALLMEQNKYWADVSKELAIGKNQLKYWADHGTTPDGNTLAKLARYFGVSTDYLLGLDETKSHLLDLFDTQPDFQDPQIKTLAKYFIDCDATGQFYIIRAAMNEYERCMAERKKAAEQAVTELKSS